MAVEVEYQRPGLVDEQGDEVPAEQSGAGARRSCEALAQLELSRTTRRTMQQIDTLHVVSRRLGHASEVFTAQVYAHVLPQQQAQAAARFAALLDRDGNDDQEDAL